MVTVVTRAQKGSKLTHAELDGNFSSLAQNVNAMLGGQTDLQTSSQVDAKIAAASSSVTMALVDQRIQAVVGAAPAALDTLEEIAARMQEDETVVSLLSNAVINKADKATTLSGYNIEDAYTRNQVDAIVAVKANASQVAADIAAAKTKAVTLTGDATGTANQDANGNVSIAVTLSGDPVNNKGNMTGAVTLNYADGNYVVGTVVGATSISMGAIADTTRAYGITVELTNGGNNVTWPGNISWVGGVAPTLRAAGVNIITLITRNGGSSWLGMSS